MDVEVYALKNSHLRDQPRELGERVWQRMFRLFRVVRRKLSLTTPRTMWVALADAFRLAQAAGVSSAVWLFGRSAKPDRAKPR